MFTWRNTVGLILAGLGTASAVYAQADWTQYQGNAQHTGFVAENVTGNQFVQQWDHWTGTAQVGLYGLPSGVAINQQGVFASIYAGQVGSWPDFYNQFNVTSLNDATGTVNWATPVTTYPNNSAVTAPSIGNGMVYLDSFGEGYSGGDPNQYPKVHGINSSTGVEQFATTHVGQWDSGSRPTVLGNQVISLGGYYGGIDGYDGTTGAHQWFTKLPQQYDFIPAMDNNQAYIYMGSGSGSPGPQISTFYALDRQTGAVNYTIQNPSDPFTTYSSISSVVLGGQNDALVIDNTGINGPKQVTSFSLDQQAVRWNRALNAVGALAVGNGVIAVPTLTGLSLIDETTGNDLWQWLAPQNESLISNVIMTNNLLFVSSNDTLYGIDRNTGALDLSTYLGRNYYQSPNLAYYNGSVVVTKDNDIVSYKVSTQSVPEPASLLLLLPACSVALVRRRNSATR